MDWLRSRHDLDDERVLIGVTAGLLWLVGAVAALIAQAMPGAGEVDPWLFAGLAVAVLAYGIFSLSGWFDWSRVSVGQHAVAAAALMPVLGVVIWATGGADSYLQPLMILALMHVAYHFRWRVSLLLALELVLIAAAPVAYEADTLAISGPSRLATFATVALVVVFVVRMLRDRLVAAEAMQREMAVHDSLTGLINRRGFDEALRDAVLTRGDVGQGRRDADERPGFALLLFDLDDFKAVNDSQGHPAGDRLLRAVAATCAAVVRPTDVLARIGGDEFALIAPEAGAAGAERLAVELRRAVSQAGAQATVAWALHPVDGAEEDALLRVADRRLYEGKAALTRS